MLGPIFRAPNTNFSVPPFGRALVCVSCHFYRFLGRLDDASESLMHTHYADEIKDALIEIDVNIQREKASGANLGWGDLLRPSPAVRLVR